MKRATPTYPGRVKYQLLVSGNTFAFPLSPDFYSTDQAVGGDFLFDSADSNAPIYRTTAQWRALSAINRVFGAVGVGKEQDNGLPKAVYVYGSALADLRLFTKAQKLTGNAVTLGSEEINNGGFDVDTGWGARSAQVSISDGVMHLLSTDGSYQYFAQVAGLSTDTDYQLGYKVARYGGGGWRFGNGSAAYATLSNDLGVHDTLFTATASNVYFERNKPGILNDLDVDDITIKPVVVS